MAVSGVTLRFVLYDILRDMRQRYAQADISEYQVLYWILIHADRLKKQHIEKRRSGEYLSEWEVSLSYTGLPERRPYIVIPARIYDFDYDRGIHHICFDQGSSDDPGFQTITFSRTTPAAAKRLSWRTEEVPSLTNPYFYRVGNSIYFLGIDESDGIASVETGLFTSFDPTGLNTSLNDANLDNYFDFPQDLIPVLKRQVLDLGLFITSLPKDLVNDGSDTRIFGGEAKAAAYLKIKAIIDPLHTFYVVDTVAQPLDSAEIDGILGISPSQSTGKRWYIQDATGTSKFYIIVSDGTDWYADSLVAF